MILSHDWRFIHLKTRKTAGTSVELSLSALCGPLDIITPTWWEEEATLRLGRPPQNYIRGHASRLRPDGLPEPELAKDYYNHMPAALVRKYIGRRLWRRYRKVAFVRNPWDREVSRFFWRTKGRAEHSPDGFRKFIMRKQIDDDWSIISIDGTLALDFVGRYESLEDDFAKLLTELGYKKSVPLARAKMGFRSTEERDYRPFYDDETRELVAQAHAPLIAAFGYTF
ncbi:sulfotransferase family 2 domain-containing protein [Reyranella sp.]|uniref:sulfotransferase family 2 domain-containing protein n=1 Tax=Reyranella sp. TaxID=1929291 RepID=UPI003D0C0074